MREQTITIGLLFDALKKAKDDIKFYYDEYEVEEMYDVINSYVIDTLEYIEPHVINPNEVDNLVDGFTKYIFNK